MNKNLLHWLVILQLWTMTSYAYSEDGITIFRPSGTAYDDFVQHLEAEFKNYDINDVEISKNDDVEDLLEEIEKQTRLIVLLDNLSVELAKRAIISGKKLPPMIAGMALNLKNSLRNFKSIAGVGYEVSPYTIVSEINKIVKNKFRRIKVLYRGSQFQNLINDARTQLAREKVQLIAVDVEKGQAGLVNQRLNRGIQSAPQEADALLVLLDNKLITRNNFQNIWIHQAKQFKIPFLCGAEKFALPPIKMCTFSAFPNPGSLASHLAEIGLSILEDGSRPDEFGVEYLVANDKILNAGYLLRFRKSIANRNIDNLKIISGP